VEIEHFALNVSDPRAMARWYVEHLGMRIAMGMDAPPYAHFLADTPGHVMIEIYHNPKDPVPDHAAQHVARVHIAFAADDPAGVAERLKQAGATFVEDVHLSDGGLVVTMRDPWGVPIQFCRRGKPLI
jgi:glyoxylase I family protein